MRLVMVSSENVVVSKMSELGQNVTVVPVSSAASSFSSGPLGTPRLNVCRQWWPRLRTSTWSVLLSALTTETPTPCRPPDTL